jgi:hypothetical protein
VAAGDDGIFSTQARIAFHHSVTETGIIRETWGYDVERE